MNYILCDPSWIESYYPFALTRPLGEMRVFGGTLKELWEKHLDSKISYLTRDHLQDLYPIKFEKDNIILNPIDILSILDRNTTPGLDKAGELFNLPFKYNGKQSLESIRSEIHSKLDYLQRNRPSFIDGMKGPCSFFHQGLISQFSNSLDCSKHNLFNDDDGPIVIEEDVTIMEGSMIKGPVHICKGSTIKMGAKIYGPTVIGPYCKIGGEVSNSIFLGYSNKSHDGFLGDSIIGEWCNIGAGTSNSNLKNDYSNVKMWDYKDGRFKDSGKQFLGLYMGDHSKCAINTSFNTGTTIGVNCNIFGSGFPRNFIPSFSWGGPQLMQKYNFDKAISVAEKVMQRRNIELTQKHVKMLAAVYDITAKYR